ncbi:AraC family transcriptional regulator [Helicovermis profundi]|uniref:DRTGG domain-containing protein n=1 Tax=Helicovermis profundi TaxID=3065157 RepID=A0AAU9EGE9_9FIRM|nr:hypothetical protein HLPR_08040 [Clostridia bacterium S502]
MNINDIYQNFGFIVLNKDYKLVKEVDDLICCDLLSWVMANGKNNAAWITVQIHNNILAVASLLDFSCIIIPNGIKVDDALISKADEEEIVIFSTDLSSYDIFKKFYEFGLK